jgi:hypothetical protein
MWGTMWLLGTGGSVTLGWLGVMVVAEEVTERPPAPLSEQAVNREATLPPPEPEPPAVVDGAPEPAAAQVIPPQGPPAAPPTTVPVSPPPPGPRAVPGNPAPQGGRTPTPPPATGDPAPNPPPRPPPVEGIPPLPPGRTKTLSTHGGTASVRYGEGSVALLWASPNAGYGMDVKASGPVEVHVRFQSDDHRSRIKAWWDNGPRHSVREFGD